jgi:ribosomal protein S6
MTPTLDEEAKEKVARTQSLVAAATAAMTSTQRREREQLTSFISKKREMFLLQMALDTKREEIQKLEHKAQMKEEALKKSELMLEEDAIRFDAFLKENDRLAHSAMKAAEEATKRKQSMQQEIKRLKYQIQALKGENAKSEDTLKEWQGYQRFLDELTDSDWRAAQEHAKQQRQLGRKTAKWRQQLDQWESAREEKLAELQEEEVDKREHARRTGKVYKAPDMDAVLDGVFHSWPRPQLDDDAFASESSGEDLPMYFTKPEQLLQLFADKEERNLFLITNKQEIEHQLEELRGEYDNTQAAMTRQTASLEESKQRLHERITAEEAKLDTLQSRLGGSSKGGESEALLGMLSQRIRSVYETCGGDLTSNPGSILMLTKLEGKLEELLAKMSRLPPEYVKEKEKALEDERRTSMRDEKLAAEASEMQRRLENSIRRSQEPAKKRSGKPLMTRSKPARKKKQEDLIDADKLRELADMKYLQ